MIIGFNSEIEQDGVIYHVQTSDRPTRSLIDTLIYLGGEIIDTLETPYVDLIKGGYDERKVLKLMQAQHRRTIFAIKKGKFSRGKEGEEAAAEVEAISITDSKGLDDMIFEYLAARPEQETLELVMVTNSRFVPGAAIFMRLVAATNLTRRVLADTYITIRIVAAGASPGLVYQGRTDDEGEATVMVIIPDNIPVPATMIIRAESEAGEDEIHQEIGAR